MAGMPAKAAKPLGQFVFMLLLGCALLVFILALLTRGIAYPNIFRPSKNTAAHNMLLTRTDIIPLEIEADCGTLIGYMIPQSTKPAPLVLYFGGNGENAASVIGAMCDNRHEAFDGIHFAQVDYPGYGMSAGKPSDRAFKQAALAVYDALSARADVTEIIVLGYSLGTGPASYVAANRDVAGLILMAPYADVADLFNTVVNIFYGPVKLLARCGYDMSPAVFAKDIEVKPLILASQNDEMVAFDSALRLKDAFPQGCEFITLTNISHSEFWQSGIALRTIGIYLDWVTDSLPFAVPQTNWQ